MLLHRIIDLDVHFWLVESHLQAKLGAMVDDTILSLFPILSMNVHLAHLYFTTDIRLIATICLS